MRTEKQASLALKIIMRGVPPIFAAFSFIGIVSGTLSYRSSLADQRERLTNDIQVMISSLETDWVQGNYSKAARQIQKRTQADMVAFYSPDCRLLESAPANEALRLSDCASAARAFPAGVFSPVTDPTGRVGRVFIQKHVDKLRIVLINGLQFLVYFAILALIYFVLLRNFLKDELSSKVHEMTSISGREPSEVYQEFAPIYGILQDYKKRIAESIAESKAREFKIEFETGMGRLAAQVAHDIRSPLAALDVAMSDASQMPEDKRILIRGAVGRIHDIANSLLSKQRAQSAGPDAAAGASPLLLSSLIEPIVSEKRLQFRFRPDIVIEARRDASSYGLFAAVQPVEFKRLVSNLVNNAVEAFGDGPGLVIVGLASRDGRAEVSVRDDGKGIPSEVMARIGRRGETYGKAGGSGLGLFHARTSAESWGGSLEISSSEGKGTTVAVLLPRARAPEEFVSELVLAPGGSVVILDDDESIHQVWDGRLAAMRSDGRGAEVFHVSAPDELRSWVLANAGKASDARFLLDYELLRFQETGVSLAEELGIGERSILVTSRYDELAIVEGCRKLKMGMIPKGLAGLVPIRLESPSPGAAGRRWDAVLIDDDALARATWKIAASRSGKSFRSFASCAEFLNESHSMDRATPVYIDVDLGGGVKGDVEAVKIRGLGFGEIYLATGHEAEKFSGLSCLSGVVGKEPPWGREEA